MDRAQIYHANHHIQENRPSLSSFSNYPFLSHPLSRTSPCRILSLLATPTSHRTLLCTQRLRFPPPPLPLTPKRRSRQLPGPCTVPLAHAAALPCTSPSGTASPRALSLDSPWQPQLIAPQVERTTLSWYAQLSSHLTPTANVPSGAPRACHREEPRRVQVIEGWVGCGHQEACCRRSGVE